MAVFTQDLLVLDMRNMMETPMAETVRKIENQTTPPALSTGGTKLHLAVKHIYYTV